MSSLRQQLLDAVKTRLETITTGNGYQTSLGSKVYLCRPIAPQDSELPQVVIWDLAEETEQRQAGVWQNSLVIELHVFQSGATMANGDFARSAVDDLHKALGTDVRWSNLALDTRPRSNRYEIDQETRKLTGTIVLEFEILYRCAAWDMQTSK